MLSTFTNNLAGTSFETQLQVVVFASKVLFVWLKNAVVGKTYSYCFVAVLIFYARFKIDYTVFISGKTREAIDISLPPRSQRLITKPMIGSREYKLVQFQLPRISGSPESLFLAMITPYNGFLRYSFAAESFKLGTRINSL